MSFLKLDLRCSPGSICCRSRKPRFLKSRCLGFPVRSRRVICTLEQASSKTERRQANYQPSLWTDHYIQSLPSSSYKDLETDAARIALLKERVKKLLDEEKGTKAQLELIDALQQLGVAYHLKKDIREALSNIHGAISQGTNSILKKDDLCSASVLFRLLREQSFTISEDVFERFRDEKGSWGDMRRYTTEEVLSLYEASHLAMEGESALDEAREVTTQHLKALLQGSALETRMREGVAHALDIPMNWRIPRLHTRWFIEAYQKRPDMDPLLLELAKLDFNEVQKLYREELKQHSWWWSDLGIGQKLPFFRDRLVENYFWAVGAAFEPEFSSCREGITKVNCFITAIDDVYDLYGTLDELELFTHAVDRWEVDVVKQLPDYMKIVFLALHNMTNDMAYKIMKKRGLNVIPHLKAAWLDLCKRYLVESKWYHHGHAPKFEEYLDNAWMTIGCHIHYTISCCTSKDVSQADLDTFANNYHDALQNSLAIIRLCNDLGTSTDELARGDVLKSVECYMREKNVSENKAREEVREIIRVNWRAIKGDRSFASATQEHVKNVAINLARTAHCVYQHGDGYGKPDEDAKDNIMKLLMEPILI